MGDMATENEPLRKGENGAADEAKPGGEEEHQPLWRFGNRLLGGCLAEAH